MQCRNCLYFWYDIVFNSIIYFKTATGTVISTSGNTSFTFAIYNGLVDGSYCGKTVALTGFGIKTTTATGNAITACCASDNCNPASRNKISKLTVLLIPFSVIFLLMLILEI